MFCICDSSVLYVLFSVVLVTVVYLSSGTQCHGEAGNSRWLGRVRIAWGRTEGNVHVAVLLSGLRPD